MRAAAVLDCRGEHRLAVGAVYGARVDARREARRTKHLVTIAPAQ